MQLHLGAGTLCQSAHEHSKNGTEGATDRAFMHHAQRTVHDLGEQTFDEEAPADEESH